MLPRISTIAVFLLFALFSGVQAGEFYCGQEDIENQGSELRSESQPRVRFVFVQFPQDSIPVPGTLTSEHYAVQDSLDHYFAAHSRGSFTFHADSDLIEPTGASGIAWEADLRAELYRDIESLPSEYQDQYSTISSWYVSSSGYASVLCAEILYKIQLDKGSNGDFFANTDYLVMIFLTNVSPFSSGPIDGRAVINVNESELPEFFDGIARGSIGLSGTCQLYLTEHQTVFTGLECAKTVAHEIVHTLGPGDGPPNLSDPTLDEGRYYYGNQNLLCQVMIEGEAIPCVGLGWLQELDWRGTDSDPLVVDFFGENLIDHTMTDIRLDGGKIYRFSPPSESLPSGAVDDQYFLIAYHDGNGIDEFAGSNGYPLFRSHGVEIWHCVGRSMFDIESASGLFDDPRDPRISGSPAAWQHPDPVLGFDNHDWWPEIAFNGQTYAARHWEYDQDSGEPGYNTYVGESDDLFAFDDGGVEFNYLSNPNPFWYEDDQSTTITKRLPQQLTNSLWIDIREDNGDGTIQVDLLTAPYEEVTVTRLNPPLPSEPIQAGDVLRISWDSTLPDSLFSDVDILFSKNNGLTFSPLPGGEGIPASGGYWDWVVGANDGTSHGKLKVIFHNNLSDYEGPFYYPDDCSSPEPGLLEIDEPVVVSETLLAPVDGQEVFAHTPVRIEWTSFFNSAAYGGYGDDPAYDVEINYVDLELQRGGGNWEELASNIILDDTGTAYPNYHYDADQNVNYFLWTPQNDQYGAEVRLRLTLYYGSDLNPEIAQSETDAFFPVYPITVKFEDKTEDVGLSPQEDGYTGVPNSLVGMDPDLDGFVDLFVGMEVDQDNHSRFFQNNGESFSEFNSVAFLLDGPPSDGNKFAIHGDINSDGYPDLLVVSNDDSRLFQNRWASGASGFEDVFGDFPRSIQLLFEDATCGAWVDWDHDGDQDLLLGRGETNGIGGDRTASPDYILVNRGVPSTWATIEVAGQNLISNAMTVLDFDRDGYNELFVGTVEESGGLHIYKETELGGVKEFTASIPGNAGQKEITNLSWVDVNGDGWFDLVLELKNFGVEILINDHSGGFSSSLPVGYGKAKNFGFLDFNADGWKDLVCYDTNAPSPNVLLMNTGGIPGFESGFVDVSLPSGVGVASDYFFGVLACPFSDDRNSDLVFSRSGEPDRYLQAVDPENPEDDPEVGVVTVRLWDSAGNVPMGYDHVVVLSDADEEREQRHFINCGSGNQSQEPLLYSFGVEGWASPFELTVVYPSGYEDVHSVVVSEAIQDIYLHDLVPADIGLSDFQVEGLLLPSEMLELTFSWKTNLRCDNSLDLVMDNTPRSNGLGCFAWFPALGNDYSGSTYSMVGLPDGTFYHELIVTDVPCSVGCDWDLVVQSGIGNIVQSSEPVIFNTGSCGITFPEISR